MASSRNLGTLTIDVIAKIGGFTGPLDQAGRIADKRMRDIERRAKQFGVVLGTAIAAAGTAAVAGIKSAIDAADELSKSAQKIGVSTEALSQLSHAADLSDVSLETLQGTLGKLTKFQAEAAQGNAEAVRTFKAFGVAIKDGDGNLRGTLPVLEDFAAVFKAMPDGPEKTAAAMRIFGKSGAELIPLLNSGADGLRAMADESDRLGLTLSTQAGKQAEAFNDDLTRLKAQFTGIERQIASGLLPELTKLAHSLQGLSADGKDGFSFVDFAIGDLSELSKSIRHVGVEIEFLKKAWKEQGLFGEGIFSVLKKAQDEFNRRETLADGLAIHGGPTGRGSVHRGALEGQADLKARQAAEAMRTAAGAGDAAAKANRGLNDELERQQKAVDDLHKQLEPVIAAQEHFEATAKGLAHSLRDDLGQAQDDYLDQLAELRTQASKGEVSTEKLAEAEENLRKNYERTTAAIRDRQDTAGHELEQMREQLKLLNAQSDAERVRLEFLQRNPNATPDQVDGAERLSKQIDDTRNAISAMDDMRQSFQQIFTDVASGQESMLDGLKSFADAFVAEMLRMAAAQASAALFGDQGTTGGGLFGGLFSKLLGGSASSSAASSSSDLFSYGLDLVGGFASGTDFAPGGMAWVGENGPELVNLPRGAQVIPHAKSMAMGGASVTQTNNFNFRNPERRKTQQQLAKEAALASKLALART